MNNLSNFFAEDKLWDLLKQQAKLTELDKEKEYNRGFRDGCAFSRKIIDDYFEKIKSGGGENGDR